MGTTGDREDGDQGDTRAVAEEAGLRLSEALGGATVAEMREMSVGRIEDAADSLEDHWRPSVDGHVLERPPAEIYASGHQLDVPTLVGRHPSDVSPAPAPPPYSADAPHRPAVRHTHAGAAARFPDSSP